MKKLNVVTYNILCPKLAYKTYFTKSSDDDLDPNLRFQKIWNKLTPYIDDQAIICLQEVGQNWVGKFHDNFSSHNYHFIPSLYGNFKNDYMGIAIAYPMNKFKSINTRVETIGPHINTKPVKKTFLSKIYGFKMTFALVPFTPYGAL